MAQMARFEPVLNTDGDPTGYHRDTETGEVCTLYDEYDDADEYCDGCDTGCSACADLPARPRGG